MRVKMLFNALVSVALALGGGSCAYAQAGLTTDPQVTFLTTFYKDYLNRSDADRAAALNSTRFYTAAVQALLATNKQYCKQFAHGDLCGYGAEADPVLDGQDRSDKLNFGNSGFTARKSGERTVDVTFKLFPGLADPGRRSLRYVLVEEGGQWLVDDVTPAVNGKYAKADSMRELIVSENALLETQARNVTEFMSMVGDFVKARQVSEFDQLMAFPFQFCGKNGACTTFNKGDSRIQKMLTDIHASYFGAKDAKGFPPAPNGEKASREASDGSVFTSGPFDLTFNRKTWWITKVDLSRAR